MNRSSASLLGAIGGFLLLGGLLSSTDGKPAETDPPFHKELLKAAGSYLAWGRVDDEFGWAPLGCRAPNPGQPAFSASTDEQTHGLKLYSIFARNRMEYLGLSKDAKVSIGQVIVKQSWIPEEITDSKAMPAKGIDYKKIISTQSASDPKADPKSRPSEKRSFLSVCLERRESFQGDKTSGSIHHDETRPQDAGDGSRLGLWNGHARWEESHIGGKD